jgi:hypothetical protein
MPRDCAPLLSATFMAALQGNVMDLFWVALFLGVIGYLAYRHGKRLGSRLGFRAGRRCRRRRRFR